MKTVLSALALAVVILVVQAQNPRSANALTCFLTGEQISGLNKVCFYDCAGSGAAITVESYQLCPLQIQR